MPVHNHESSTKVARAYLAGMIRRGELLPGSIDPIMDVMEGRGATGADLLGAVAAYVGGTHHPIRGEQPAEGARFLDPRAEPRRELLVEAVVARLQAGGVLRDSASTLVNHLAVDFGIFKDAGKVAEHLAGKLWSGSDRSLHSHLAEPPDAPRWETVNLEALRRYREFIDPSVDLEQLARSIGPQAGHGVEHGRRVAEIVQGRRSIWRDGEEPRIDWSSPDVNEVAAARVAQEDAVKADKARRAAALEEQVRALREGPAYVPRAAEPAPITLREDLMRSGRYSS
jgi:hypothetical protein